MEVVAQLKTAKAGVACERSIVFRQIIGATINLSLVILSPNKSSQIY